MADKLRAISGTTALGLFVFLVVAVVVFQWNAKVLNLPDWITTVVGPCASYIIYYCWRKGEKQKSDFKPFILHVENSQVQQGVLYFGLTQQKLDFNIQPFESGEKALEWLTRRDFLRLKPDVIILDLHLGSGMTGQEFLEKLKTNQDLFAIPVIILSSTPRAEADRQDIIDTCAFYIERDQSAGIEYLKEAILACDPRQQRSPIEEIATKCEEYRKLNQEWRENADNLKRAIMGGSPVEKARACALVTKLSAKVGELSGRSHRSIKRLE